MRPRPTLDEWTAVTDGVSEREILRVTQVNRTTLTRWRAGRARMPYATQLLLRITFRGELPPRGELWRAWRIGHDGLLYAPDLARGFSPADLYELHWLKLAATWREARGLLPHNGTARPDPGGIDREVKPYPRHDSRRDDTQDLKP